MKKKINQDETELPFYLQNGYIDWRKEYREKCNLLDEDYKEVDCLQFYSDIFPPESIESCWEDHRPNPILTYCRYLKGNRSPAMFHAAVYSDYQNLELVRDNQMALLGMCSYSGSAPTGINAYRCHGLCIDLDDVTCLCLQHGKVYFSFIRVHKCPVSYILKRFSFTLNKRMCFDIRQWT